jgi:hypothetical protein
MQFNISEYVINSKSPQRENLRLDYVFSNWIYAWFILFFFGLVRNSPLLPILIGIVANAYEYISLKDSKSELWGTNYLIWNMNIKLFPAAVILCGKSNNIKWKEDVVALFLVYGIYMGWLFLNGVFARKPINNKNVFNYNTR